MEFKSLVAEFQKGRHADRAKTDNLEAVYSNWAANNASTTNVEKQPDHPITSAIGEIRKGVKTALEGTAKIESADSANLTSRVTALEKENKTIKAELKDLKDLVQKMQISTGKNGSGDAKTVNDTKKTETKPKENADEEIDLFGSDEEEDEEAAKIKEMRLKAYQEKKSKKPGPIAKSSVILDVKPWDDETDMAETEKLVRAIGMDGLVWGASKLVPVGYGIKKLQIMCVVEDDKVSIEELQEKIEAFEDFVQSVDIAAFNKI